MLRESVDDKEEELVYVVADAELVLAGAFESATTSAAAPACSWSGAPPADGGLCSTGATSWLRSGASGSTG